MWLVCLIGISVLGVGAALWWDVPSVPSLDLAKLPVIDQTTEARIVAFCRACHAMPLASSFPRDAWHHEVMQGYTFYAQSGRHDLDPPPPHLAVAYFRSRAPESLVLPRPAEANQPLRVTFRAEPIARPADQQVPPAISHLRWGPLAADAKPELLTLDMRRGELTAHTLQPGRLSSRVLSKLRYPCHIEPCDLDGDGRSEFVVADLGSVDPSDHDRGRVLWMRPDGKPGKPVELMSDVGRIADVRPLDANGDGLQDLIVAEFGWHTTGGIWLLRQQHSVAGKLSFKRERLSELPGTIHVPVHDFDGDGKPDILALVSQEHERLDLFLNRQPDEWERRTIWAAPDPAFGCSGMQLADLDADGDIDVLLTNGDSFDSMYLKPSHGVRWLENQGTLQFAEHPIGDLPGAYAARSGDLDGDGDFDVLACVWLPRQSPNDLDRSTLATLVCFEQTSPGKFSRHTLERGAPYFAAIEVADFDGDGDLDFAVGSNLANIQQSPHAGVVWWNEAVKSQSR